MVNTGEPLLVLGTSDFSLVVADIAEDAGWAVAGFVENMDRARVEAGLDGRKVTWFEDLHGLTGSHQAVCGLGTTRRSKFTAQAEAQGMRFATVIHPTAHVSSRSTLGPGCIVSPGGVVAGYSTLGSHVVLNRGAMIGHHTTIGDFCSVQAGAQVAGRCTVGEATWVGIGAVVSDHLNVGRGSVIGAGAVVITDVPSGVMVVGVPAQVIREGIESR